MQRQKYLGSSHNGNKGDSLYVMSDMGYSPDRQSSVIKNKNKIKSQTISSPFEGHTDWVTSVTFLNDGK